MAKNVHQVNFKGKYDHDRMIIGEYDKKSDRTTYYSLRDALAGFHGKQFSISFKEEDGIPSVDPDEIENDEDE